jgi:hypothetical protein
MVQDKEHGNGPFTFINCWKSLEYMRSSVSQKLHEVSYKETKKLRGKSVKV